MKYFSYMLCMMVISFSLFSGCKTQKTGPKEITMKFLHAIQQSNYDKAKKYATADSKSMLDALAAFQKMLPEDSREKFETSKITITQIKNNDSLTVVTYKSDQDTTLKTLNLKNRKGTWRVAFTKETVLPDFHQAMTP